MDGKGDGSLNGAVGMSNMSQRDARQASSPDPRVYWERQVSCHTHRLCDPLAEDRQKEEGSDRWGQVAGDSLDVVEELPAVGALDDGDPEDADGNQEHHKQSAGRAQGAVRCAQGGTGMG